MYIALLHNVLEIRKLIDKRKASANSTISGFETASL
jgi:hypothetical protein